MKYNITDYIKNIIKNHGPLTIDRFVQITTNYYYNDIDSIGEHSDFITAPEISQMFGEIIAIYLYKTWSIKNKGSFSLVELGPGNGVMMSDILRTIKNFKEMYSLIDEVALIENSLRLKIIQKNTLKKFNRLKINWYTTLENLEGNSFFIIANEFFDILPIKQFYLKGTHIYEIVVSLDKDDNFTYGLSNNLSKLINIQQFKQKKFIEVSEHREYYIEQISKKILNNQGATIIIDYGYLRSPGTSTLQAVKHQQKVNFFHHAGFSDITSLVDFTKIQNCFKKRHIDSNIMNQSDFLIKYGILERAKILLQSGMSEEKVYYQLKKLISRDEMGILFKVLFTT